eukprot:Rhum_TRINITY_DN14878_c0_g1::Rhum_TRINITY_DN14878_c0_g1_i3::g.124110::m.124110
MRRANGRRISLQSGHPHHNPAVRVLTLLQAVRGTDTFCSEVKRRLFVKDHLQPPFVDVREQPGQRVLVQVQPDVVVPPGHSKIGQHRPQIPEKKRQHPRRYIPPLLQLHVPIISHKRHVAAPFAAPLQHLALTSAAPRVGSAPQVDDDVKLVVLERLHRPPLLRGVVDDTVGAELPHQIQLLGGHRSDVRRLADGAGQLHDGGADRPARGNDKHTVAGFHVLLNREHARRRRRRQRRRFDGRGRGRLHLCLHLAHDGVLRGSAEGHTVELRCNDVARLEPRVCVCLLHHTAHVAAGHAREAAGGVLCEARFPAEHAHVSRGGGEGKDAQQQLLLPLYAHRLGPRLRHADVLVDAAVALDAHGSHRVRRWRRHSQGRAVVEGRWQDVCFA